MLTKMQTIKMIPKYTQNYTILVLGAFKEKSVLLSLCLFIYNLVNPYMTTSPEFVDQKNAFVLIVERSVFSIQNERMES